MRQARYQQQKKWASLLLTLWGAERMTAVATVSAVATVAVVFYPGKGTMPSVGVAHAAMTQAREREKEKQKEEPPKQPEPAREREEEKQRQEEKPRESFPTTQEQYRHDDGQYYHQPRRYRQGYEHEYYGDSSRIVFASDRDGGDWEIYLTDAQGREVHRLTRRRGDDLWPVLSPDRRRVAYVSRSAEEGQGIVVQDLYGGGRARRLTSNASSGAEDSRPAWSPDGRRIAYASTRNGDTDIYVIDAEGREPGIRLTASPAARDTMPAWSPDGRTLAFISEREGRDALYLLDLRRGNSSTPGPEVQRLFWPDRGAAAASPRFSPDGQRIIFTLSEESGESGLYLLEYRNGELRRLARRSGYSSGIRLRPETSAWSPDGRRVVFAAEREGRLTLYTLRLSDPDRIQRLLTDNQGRADHIQPDWR